MTEFSGRGDARRSMELLWGRAEPSGRGPKPGLDAEAIATAAIELADADGLDAVSMRKVAERLGRSAMALYTYVPGKAELIDLMVDRVLVDLPTVERVGDRWREAAEASARQAWAFYERHPWVLQVSGARASLGPHELDRYEAQLAHFDGLGLSASELTRAVAAVSGFVRGSAKAVADARTAEQATGISDDDWWNARSPFLDELVGEAWTARYPTLTRLGSEQAFDQLDRPDDTTPYTVQEALDAFEFGLQRLLDGLDAHLARLGGDAPEAGPR